MNALPDPTYNKAEINKNPIWKAAFILSECKNIDAPIGWSNWIWVVDELDKVGLINKKVKKP